MNTPNSRLTTFAVSEIRWTVTPVASASSCNPRGAPSCFAARYTTAATIASMDRPRERPAFIAFERGPVGALIHEALVDHEAAVVAHALAADRIDVEGEAATVRAAGGIRTR